MVCESEYQRFTARRGPQWRVVHIPARYQGNGLTASSVYRVTGIAIRRDTLLIAARCDERTAPPTLRSDPRGRAGSVHPRLLRRTARLGGNLRPLTCTLRR